MRRFGRIMLAWSVIGAAPDVCIADPVDAAERLIGRPYVWGAEGPNAFDCSGLVQYVFAQFGVDLPRRAVQQSEVGTVARGRLQRGDLVFFATDRSQPRLVTHVGIYEAGNRMIDASSRYGNVRREDLTDAYWTPRLLFATRLDGDGDYRERPASIPDRPARRSEPPPASHPTAARVLRRAAEDFVWQILQRPR